MSYKPRIKITDVIKVFIKALTQPSTKPPPTTNPPPVAKPAPKPKEVA